MRQRPLDDVFRVDRRPVLAADWHEAELALPRESFDCDACLLGERGRNL